MRPPRAAAAILRVLAPGRERALLEELADEFDRIAGAAGIRSARRWYWGQALRSVSPLVRLRLSAAWRGVAFPRLALAPWLDDGQQAVRWVRRHPALSLVVTGTLGAAAAAVLAAFAIAEAAIFNPLPDPNPGQLVTAWTTGPARPPTVDAVSWPDFIDLRASATSFAALTAYSPESVRFTGHGDPRELDIARVGEAFEQLLPASFVLGRPFNESDFAAARPRTAILQHRFWLTEFGGDPGVIGRTIMLDEQPFEIVGVLPPSRLPLPLEPNDAWIPLIASRAVPWQVSRGTGWLSMVGRLKPGTSIAAAQSELSSLAARLATAYPGTNSEKVTARVAALADDVAGPIAPMLALLAVGLGAVLVIACGNIANLLLSSASTRRREFAVRQAIGASSARLARQVFLETLILCAAAAALGLAAAASLATAFTSMYPSVIARADLAITPAMVAAAGILALILAIVLTAAGVSSATRGSVSVPLHSGLRSTSRDGVARPVLVSLQVALSVLLVVGGVALVRTVSRLAAVDPGFRAGGVLTFRVMPSGERFASGAATIAAYDRMLRGLAQVPGVRSAAAATAMPMTTSGWMFGIRPHGGATEVRVVVNLVSTDYFETLGIGLRDGRLLTDGEQHGSEPVAVVNEPLARLIAPSGPVVGTTFPYSERAWRIVGVVAGTRGRQLRQPAMPELFIPWRMAGRRPQAIAVRVDGDALALLPALARQIHEVDPSAPLADVAMLDARLADAMRAETFRAALLGTLAALALGLAALGAYSVTAFAVARRRREYGIRLALGERPGSILGRAIRTTATPTLIGTCLGLAAALAAGRWLAPFLYETPVGDVRVLGGTAALMIAISVAAALGSARDAARTDPIGVLRME